MISKKSTSYNDEKQKEHNLFRTACQKHGKMSNERLLVRNRVSQYFFSLTLFSSNKKNLEKHITMISTTTRNISNKNSPPNIVLYFLQYSNPINCKDLK